jgi:hypothetical protein
VSHDLLQLEVLPLYAQVTVQDRGTTDIPDWETGEERAVATSHAVLIATRPDTDGKVLIRVVHEPLEGREIVFDGMLDLTSGDIEVGNLIAGVVEHVSTGVPGSRRVQISVDPPGAPAVVTVAIEGV